MKYLTWIYIAFLFTIIGCSQANKKHLITVDILYQGIPLNCNSLLANKWQLSQLYLYLSDIAVLNEQQKWQPVMLAETPSQHQNVALLGVNCADETNATWQLELSDNLKGKQLKATVGVPFDLNHQNPMMQQSPLNVPNMFWVWQTGHKFMRFEMQSNTENWLFHLGSTGCSSASALRSPKQACVHPNRVSISLGKIKQGVVQLDIAPWFNDIVFSEQSNCKSARDNIACQLIFANIARRTPNSL
ncbi:metallo-mystery pair system four-Cys motif protein [Thalassotalea sp. 1_MG-2023]|uniref:MbnP family copper-binding protein n=1 Tax=Thalassotalea sp. 1_MG-2023 TaxID=3062680 RepID=UPI0026E4443B|nr:MbnP family copper-binding protein [Thalassotalea sp. 1_MG-2023]MDO6427244.1 metallo-mystery pair system four-Cys motif protein [Thalassotalea sp. 1_MG-2023]